MKVVIVGGGFCGVSVAKKLDRSPDIETVLIDQKEYFEYYPNLHKIITKPAYLKKLQVPYNSILKNTTILTEKVLTIASKYVKTQQQKILYDYLVIATGIDYPILLENTQNVHVLKNGSDALEIAKKIQQSTHLLIVGGGVIGTEIAGEIITKHSTKKVTFVHSHQHLIERTSSDAWEYAEEFLTKNGVTFYFSEKIISQKEGVFLTNYNHHIFADLCIFCTGIQPNPSFMHGFEQECYSKQKFLVVNKYLQLKGYPHIFVGGDINDVDIEKTGHNAKVQGKNIAKNIINIHKEKPLEPFKKPHPIIIIGLGDLRGIIYLKRVIVGLMIPGIIKWFIEKLTIIGLKKRW